MPHEFESGFFVAKPAWHGLGKVLNNPPTTQQAIAEADLDWIVEEHPIYQSPEPHEYSRLPNYKVLIRSSDRQTLGVVGKNYIPLQNQDAFKWFDFLLHEGNVSLEAAGSLKRGKRIWVLAKIDRSTADIDNGDTVNPYLLLSNSHDGSLAVWIQFTPIRVVCWNTLSYATASRHKEKAVGKAFRIRHSSNLNEQLSIAQNALDFAKQQWNDSIVSYRQMARKKIDKRQFEQYLEHVFDLDLDSVTSIRAYPQIESNFLKGRGNEGKNLWHAYNAVTEWLDYQRGRTQATRLNSAWFGDSNRIRAKAHQAAVGLLC